MNTVLRILIPATLILSIMYMVPGSIQSLQQYISAYAQEAGRANSSPVAAVITINRDTQGNIIYVPNNLTVKVDDEIFALNNSTDNQSVTNGMGPDDPLAGKYFDTGPIPPKGFAEFVVSNVSPGNYTFYSTNSTSSIGFLIIEPNG